MHTYIHIHIHSATFEQLGISLAKKEYHKDVKPLMRSLMSAFFGNHTGLVDMVTQHLPSPGKATANYVDTNYTGELNTELAEEMKKCSLEGPAAMQIVKLYHKPDCASFDAFGRVISGTIKIGDTVSVLGEGYTLEDDEDMTVKTVTDIWCVCMLMYVYVCV
jgi:U5 small nuclear ribonucleoprotein component